MEKYRIKTVSEFIKTIEDIGMEDYIYRGQIHPYFRIQASGFRPYKGGWSSNKIYDIEGLSNCFYRRILNSLSGAEKKHFLAYCQHHGIPTNLVDFSYSPLVALFFSCDGKGEFTFKLSDLIGEHSIDELEKDSGLKERLLHNLINESRKDFYSEYGQVYLIKRSRLIDITDIVVELNGGNIFEKMLVDRELRKRIGFKIINHFQSMNNEESVNYICNLVDTYKNNSMNFYECASEMKQEYTENIFHYAQKLKEKYTDKALTELYDFVCSEFEDEEIVYDFETMYCMEGKIYFLLFYNLIKLFKEFPNKYMCTLDFYFTYTPPNLFSRLEKQQGLFIYQPYLYTKDGTYNYNELTVQYICPDVTIEIDNYSDINRELDCLGINTGFIYGDIDSIAKSVQKSVALHDAETQCSVGWRNLENY